MSPTDVFDTKGSGLAGVRRSPIIKGFVVAPDVLRAGRNAQEIHVTLAVSIEEFSDILNLCLLRMSQFNHTRMAQMSPSKAASKGGIKTQALSAENAHQRMARLAFDAVKKYASLVHEFPGTDFLDCEEYPYSGHQQIFEDTFRKLLKVADGRTDISRFCVDTYEFGYMRLVYEPSNHVPVKLSAKMDAVVNASHRLSGQTCTICGAEVKTREHLKGPDPVPAFCSFHSELEIDTMYESDFDIARAAKVLRIKLPLR